MPDTFRIAYHHLFVFCNIENERVIAENDLTLVVLDGSAEDQGKYPPLNFTNEELFDIWNKSE